MSTKVKLIWNEIKWPPTNNTKRWNFSRNYREDSISEDIRNVSMRKWNREIQIAWNINERRNVFLEIKDLLPNIYIAQPGAVKVAATHSYDPPSFPFTSSVELRLFFGGIHAPTRAHILGPATNAWYVYGIAGVLLLDGRRSPLHPATVGWMENALWTLGCRPLTWHE